VDHDVAEAWQSLAEAPLDAMADAVTLFELLGLGPPKRPLPNYYKSPSWSNGRTLLRRQLQKVNPSRQALGRDRPPNKALRRLPDAVDVEQAPLQVVQACLKGGTRG